MSAENPKLYSALVCAERGWPVIALHTPTRTGVDPACSCSKGAACGHVGKHPRHDALTLPHGARSATTDPATIRDWWTRWPEANVGVACGPCSGLVVLDIDPRNGGNDTLDDLVSELGKLPETVEALTGGGGRHLVFRWRGGKVRGSLGSGVDVLGDGKLIVVEPSLHPSGHRYAWEWSSNPSSVEVADLPGAWISRLSVADPGGKGDRESRDNGKTGTSGRTVIHTRRVWTLLSLSPQLAAGTRIACFGRRCQTEAANMTAAT